MAKTFGAGDLELLSELVCVLAGDEAVKKVRTALAAIAVNGEQYGEVIAGLAWGALQDVFAGHEEMEDAGNGAYGIVKWSDTSRTVYEEFRSVLE